MPMYTFIRERSGGTYISQFDEPTLMDAWQAFVAYEDIRSGIPLDMPFTDWVLPVAVDTVKSVWCTSAHDKDDNFVLVNIVKTDTSGPAERLEM
jgi:hypothetical protein